MNTFAVYTKPRTDPGLEDLFSLDSSRKGISFAKLKSMFQQGPQATKTRKVKSSLDGTQEVYYLKEGFSFMAFFFTGLWLLYHRLWKEFALFFFASTIVNQLYLTGSLTPGGAFIAFMALHVGVGFLGRDLIRLRLLRIGYKLEDIITANSFDEAEYRYIERSLQKDGKLKFTGSES